MNNKNKTKKYLSCLALILCLTMLLVTSVFAVPTDTETKSAVAVPLHMPAPTGGATTVSEPVKFIPESNGKLLLELKTLIGQTTNSETGAVYTQAFGDESLYKYNAETGNMNTVAVGGAGRAVSYGGKTNLLLGPDAKYTISYMASKTTGVAGGSGIRISYASDSKSIGIYANSDGKNCCLARGTNTWNGYSGNKQYTKDMAKRGVTFQHDGFAKFDIEINGYVVSGYVNDVLLFREDIQMPSNASAVSGIDNNYMSDTLSIVISEYVAPNQTAGELSTEYKDLKIYSGLIHQEVYDLSVLGIQVGTVANGTRNVRFIAGGIRDTYGAAGLEITAILDGERRVFQYETAEVTRKLTASAEDSAITAITAEGQGVEYLFGYTLTGVPEDLNIKFVVRPYLVSYGTKMYGIESTYRIGDFPVILEPEGGSLDVDFSEFGS